MRMASKTHASKECDSAVFVGVWCQVLGGCVYRGNSIYFPFRRVALARVRPMCLVVFIKQYTTICSSDIDVHSVFTVLYSVFGIHC